MPIAGLYQRVDSVQLQYHRCVQASTTCEPPCWLWYVFTSTFSQIITRSRPSSFLSSDPDIHPGDRRRNLRTFLWWWRSGLSVGVCGHYGMANQSGGFLASGPYRFHSPQATSQAQRHPRLLSQARSDVSKNTNVRVAVFRVPCDSRCSRTRGAEGKLIACLHAALGMHLYAQPPHRGPTDMNRTRDWVQRGVCSACYLRMNHDERRCGA